jgi:hypothetical protein
MGISMTVLSYGDHLDAGLTADRELVPDVWELADDLRVELEELVALVPARRTRCRRAS